MTKEKAQIVIGNIPIKPEVLDDCYDITEYQEAKAMAIEALAQESITWIVGKDNCQVAVRNMPIDKMQKICAIIGEEEQQPCEDAVARTRSDQPDLGINFNDKIKVKLTDLGKDIFYHQYDWILEQNPKIKVYIKPHHPKVDEEGYTTFLLWEFMQLYGRHIGMAAPNVVLPLEIIKCENE